MLRYTAVRLVSVIPVFLGATLLIYLITWALPGDPFAGKCGEQPCPPAYVAAMRESLGMDDPLIVQYLRYLGGFVTGDLGRTMAGVPIGETIARTIPVTLQLAGIATVFQVVLGVGVGTIAAIRRNGVLDHISLGLSLVAIALPAFAIAFFLQYALALGWQIFPATAGPSPNLYALILPGFALAAVSIAFVLRLTRSTLTEVLDSSYVRTLTAKGLPRWRVVGVHGLKNAAVPIITFIGVDAGTLIGGSVVIEGIFNINGLGGLVFRSIQLREGVIVTTVITLLVLAFLLLNLVVDLVSAAIDPRIRLASR